MHVYSSAVLLVQWLLSVIYSVCTLNRCDPQTLDDNLSSSSVVVIQYLPLKYGFIGIVGYSPGQAVNNEDTIEV